MLEFFKLSLDPNGFGSVLDLLFYASVLIATIWKTINDIVFNSKNFDLMKVNSQIQSTYLEFKETLFSTTLSRIEMTTWSPPPQGQIKLNIDVCVGQLNLVVAVVAQIDSSSILTTYTEKLPFTNPSVVETTTLLCVARVARDYTFDCIIMKSDNTILIDSLKKLNPTNYQDIDSLIGDCLEQLKSFFLWDGSQIPQTINFEAHNLASWSSSSSSFGFM